MVFNQKQGILLKVEMKILFLSFNMAFHGGATFYRALNIGTRLAKRGHEVILMASSGQHKMHFCQRVIDQLTLVEAPGIMPTRWRHGYDFYEALKRSHWVAQRHFDLVHAFDSRPTVIYPALAAKRGGSFLAMDWCDWFGRGGAVEERTNPVLRILLNKPETFYEEAFRHKAELNTVINSQLFQRAQGLGLSLEKIYLLRNGSDTQRIGLIQKKAARSELGLPEQAPILGYMGALFKADGDLLDGVIQNVRQVYPATRLVLIGNTKTSFPENQHNLKTGFVNEKQVNLYLCACDILLIPQTDTIANRGRWPSKINDYIAAGRPVAVTNVGDAANVVKKEEIGIVTAAGSIEFASGVIDLLRQPAGMEEMGKKARLLAEGKYNWDSIVQDLEAQYLRLM